MIRILKNWLSLIQVALHWHQNWNQALDHEAILDLGHNFYAFYKFYDNIQTKFETCFRIVSQSCCYLHTSIKRLISFWWMMLQYDTFISLACEICSFNYIFLKIKVLKVLERTDSIVGNICIKILIRSNVKDPSQAKIRLCPLSPWISEFVYFISKAV